MAINNDTPCETVCLGRNRDGDIGIVERRYGKWGCECSTRIMRDGAGCVGYASFWICPETKHWTQVKRRWAQHSETERLEQLRKTLTPAAGGKE